MNGIVFFLGFYIWYRANRVLKHKSKFNFKKGSYFALALYLLSVGILQCYGLIIDTYSKLSNQFSSDFLCEFLVNGVGTLVISILILAYVKRVY